MKQYTQSPTVTTGLAIFAMLFGAGNLIFPLKSGVVAGDQTWIALIGFSISGILLPLIGLVGMVFFDGDYRAFFERVGKIPGNLLIFFCMLVLGPLLVMPRIMALTYRLMTPFLNNVISCLEFSLLFALLTFICCYKKDAILNLLGKFLSPLKLLSLGTIIAIGLWTRNPVDHAQTSLWNTFKSNFISGYQTLDLLGTIFFAYIIISILKKTLPHETSSDQRALAKIMLYGGLIGGALLALVYIGMAYLGAFHGHGLSHSLSEGQIFIDILMRVLGNGGTLFISLTVFIACLSTMIALASVVTEYLHNDIVNKKINYTILLALVVLTAALIAQFQIDKLLQYSAPLIFMGYPAIAVLTICNIAYKLWDFKPVKIPVLIALMVGIYMHLPQFIDLISGKDATFNECKKVADSPVAQL